MMGCRVGDGHCEGLLRLICVYALQCERNLERRQSFYELKDEYI